MQNAQQMNSFDIDGIDNQVGQRYQHQFSRSVSLPKAFHGECLSDFAAL
jgi:hypothetical protein